MQSLDVCLFFFNLLYMHSSLLYNELTVDGAWIFFALLFMDSIVWSWDWSLCSDLLTPMFNENSGSACCRRTILWLLEEHYVCLARFL